ncbi:MinD/ParA family protein [Saccharothrix sp. NPDC042600]|uniref:MinD/ParA family ATP-binding protein n=1 Tax=Saccharothrix TaxID=2071 RepID=UPI0033FB9124
MDLVSSLDRLAREGGFTRNDTARHWADQDPQRAREHGILKVSDGGVESIERRRLSETMKMTKGPIPVGLVEAFVELWAPQRPTSEVRTVTDRLLRLRDQLAQAGPAATAAPTRQRKHRPSAQATTSSAQEELLRTRQELVKAQENETRFRDLAGVLYVALVGLQSAHRQTVHDPQTLERDSVVVRAGQPPDNPLTRADGPEEADNPSARPYLHRLLSGWRKTVHALTGGPDSPQQSLPEARRRELITRITRPSAGCHRIAVVGVETGVAASVITACLGSALARLRYRAAAGRPERVIAVDANADDGDTLAAKTTGEPKTTIRHFLRDAFDITGYEDVRAYTFQTPGQLEILASDLGPTMSESFGVWEYPAALALLEHSYDMLLADCGTGLKNPAIKGILDLADSLVLVSTDSVDGAQALADTLDGLQSRGHHSLVARAVTVIRSSEPASRDPEPGGLPDHLAQRCRTVVRIPFDAHLDGDPDIEAARIGPETRLALLELAAAVADDFTDLEPREPPAEPPTQPIPIIPAAAPRQVPVPSDPRTGPVMIVPTGPPTQPIRITAGPALYPGTTIPWAEKLRIIDVLFAAYKLTPDARNAARHLAFRSAGFPHPDIEREFRALVNRAVGEPRRTISRLIFHHPQFPTSSQAAAGLDAAWEQGALTEQEYLTKKYWVWEFGRHTPPQVPRADAIYVLDARLAQGTLSPDEYCEIVAAVRQRTDLYPADYPHEPIGSWP